MTPDHNTPAPAPAAAPAAAAPAAPGVPPKNAPPVAPAPGVPPVAPAARRPMMSDEEFHRRVRRNFWMDVAAYTFSGGVIGTTIGVLIGLGIVRLFMHFFG